MIAIKVQSLGKRFKLFSSPGRRFLEYMSFGKIAGHTDFWALKDITFEIPKGTTLGILGQNGSGKSTLLSILAGVLYPSAGSFRDQWKSLCDSRTGSGFHPEFSGRDNVYMYGSIMGLSKPEIDARFEEIVQFSELGDFINQPLRTYSSGMTVRLAFSVAVHVDADILIVDEALAVGDAIFQHRCFRKIREMQANGKTILYVGHDTEAVRNLCTAALLLDGGRIIERGDPNYVVNKYYALIAERERTYSEGNVSEHGEVPRDEHQTVFDFILNLHEARIDNTKDASVQAQIIEIQSLPRNIIFAHPPSKIKYSVFIMPRTALIFAIGILPEAWDKIPQGVKFDIKITYDGISENIFSRVLLPKRNIGDRGWHNFIVSLEKYHGKTVCLTFSTSGSGNDLSYCWSAWGWVKIIQFIGCPKEANELDNSDPKTINDTTDPTMISEKIIRYGNRKAIIENVELLNSNGSPNLSFKTGEKITIRYSMISYRDFVDDLTIGFVIRNKFTEVYGTNTRWKKCDLKEIKKGRMPIVNISMDLAFGDRNVCVNIGNSDCPSRICR